MMIERMAWTNEPPGTANVGLIVLQEDPVSAPAIQKILPDLNVQVARVPPPPPAGCESAMIEFELQISEAASSLLPSTSLTVIGFACTTGAIQIGRRRLAAAVASGAAGARCVNPVAAAFSAFRQLGAHRLAIISPYERILSVVVAEAFGAAGFSVDRLCYFDAPDDSITAISAGSVIQAARRVAESKVDGLFLSCTGMRSLELIDTLEAEIGIPVLSSIQAMAWQLAIEMGTSAIGPGVLLRETAPEMHR